MVEHPADYGWSSYRANTQGDRNELVNPHFIYRELALMETARQLSYRELFRYNLEPGLADEISDFLRIPLENARK